MPEAWNSSGGSPGWGIDVSTASEQPGPGLPEENTANTANTADTANAVPAGPVEPTGPQGAERPEGLAEEAATAASDAADRSEPDQTAAEPETETEEERLARERVEFDKLVAAFHGESAPDPQPQRPGGAGTRKIVRYPVLEPRQEWHAEIVEPTDETTVDPLDHVEHYEQPDPPLPQVAAATLAAWVMLVGGVAFLVLHTLLKWQTPDYFGWLAVIGVFGGIISLVARMKPDRDEYDDPDNGAVV